MKTALLAQNEALAARDYQPNHDSSVLPLSHSVQYPVDVDGAILPCCIIEVNPHESYLISNEILLRQLQPLKVPQMTRYTLVTAYYYCSNRLGWKSWEIFADQADKGRTGVDYSVEIPVMANEPIYYEGQYVNVLLDEDKTGNARNQNYKNTLHTYMNVSHGMKLTSDGYTQNGDSIDDIGSLHPDLPVAFPFFDYQMICRDFYTNIDRIDDNPLSGSDFYDFDNPFSDWAFTNLFPVDSDEIKLHDGVNVTSGYQTGVDSDVDSLKGFVLDKVRYHDFRPDYFTSSKRAPMRGEAPTVDTTIAVSKIDASDVFAPVKEEQLPSTSNFLGVTSNSELYDEWEEKFVAGESWADPNTEGKQSLSPRVVAQQNAQAAFEKLKVDLTVSKSITCAQIMLMTQLTLWKTLNMLSKPTYNDFLNAHFGGVKVGDSLAEAPQYIGGTSQVIDVNEVLQTSADSGTQKLGNQAAIAHSYSSSNVGKFFAQDFGFIIGVMFIIPDVVYRPAMPRWASRRTIEEYYFPEFANLSMQATLNKELFYSNDEDWNNQALGYVGAYDELRSIPNYCAGLMLDDDNHSDLTKWLVTRKFSNDNKPAINQRFLSCKGNVDKEAWTVPNEPKFMFQCANYVKAAREMPWIAIPKLS